MRTIACPFLLLTFLVLFNGPGQLHAQSPDRFPGGEAIPADSSGMSSLNSQEFSKSFGRGWNLGNSLEAIGGETAWGNPEVSPELIDGVHAAGFRSIRIPVAWSKFSSEESHEIDAKWLARVKEVVDLAMDRDMYVILNEHWDGGWLQPTYEARAEASARLSAIWRQVALYFRDYDDRLIFAGTNEVMVEGDYGSPVEEYYTVQNSYNQLFVDVVRSTGGRNAFRYLAVQGYNTNIDHTLAYFEMPGDDPPGRLLVEVHYYDPYAFTLDGHSRVYAWGSEAEGTAGWGDEQHADRQFSRMKERFVDRGIGVIVGEYAVMRRLDLKKKQKAQHSGSLLYWTRYITGSMVRQGLVPFYWDNGYTGDKASGLFDRASGMPVYPKVIEALMTDPPLVSE